MERPNPTEVLADFTDAQVETLVGLFEELRTYAHVRTFELARELADRLVAEAAAEGESVYTPAINDLQESLGKASGYSTGRRYQDEVNDARRAQFGTELFERVLRDRATALKVGFEEAHPITIGNADTVEATYWEGYHQYARDDQGHPLYDVERIWEAKKATHLEVAYPVNLAGVLVGYVKKGHRSTKFEYALLADIDGHGDAQADGTLENSARGFKRLGYGSGTGKLAAAEALRTAYQKSGTDRSDEVQP